MLSVVIGCIYLVVRGRDSIVCEATSAARTGAPLVMTIYTDFQCSYCARLDQSLRRYREASNLRIVVKHYPIDHACNPRVRVPRHEGACLQARAAICAETGGAEEAFRDQLFNSGARDQTGLLQLARRLGLESRQFSACMASHFVEERLRTDVESGIASGVRGAPTLFIEGKRHVGPLTEDDLACLTRWARSAP